MTDIDVDAIRRAAEQRTAQLRANLEKAREAKRAKLLESLQKEEPKAVPRPEPKPTHGWARVLSAIFHGDCAVNVPGRVHGVYPATDTKVEERLTGPGRLLRIWLNSAEDELVLEHPESGIRTRVPRSNVKQYERDGDQGASEAKPREVGMVRALKL